MAQDFTMFVGTVGGGLSISHDQGESWAQVRNPIPSECNVRAVTVYPNDPQRILAGTDGAGVYRSERQGRGWEKLDSPLDGEQVWSLAVDPSDSGVIFAGVRPGAFRSTDGGAAWERLRLDVRMDGPLGAPRTTIMLIDPRDRGTIWAGTEVDGVYRSRDRGDSWERLPDVGPDVMYGDIHGLAVDPGGAALYSTSPFGVSTSMDDGESWTHHGFPDNSEGERHTYCRAILMRPDDPDLLLVGNGNGIPGTKGTIRRSRDGGLTWEAAELPVAPNSVLYCFGSHPELPDTIAAACLYGYVYLSSDGGESWRKLRKEFGEIRTLALSPN